MNLRSPSISCIACSEINPNQQPKIFTRSLGDKLKVNLETKPRADRNWIPRNPIPQGKGIIQVIIIHTSHYREKINRWDAHTSKRRHKKLYLRHINWLIELTGFDILQRRMILCQFYIPRRVILRHFFQKNKKKIRASQNKSKQHQFKQKQNRSTLVHTVGVLGMGGDEQDGVRGGQSNWIDPRRRFYWVEQYYWKCVEKNFRVQSLFIGIKAFDFLPTGFSLLSFFFF